MPTGTRVKAGVIVSCGLVLTMTFGCLRPTAQSARIDVVSNPELVKYCTLKGEGKYTAVGETNALTLAKNAAAERGGNVLLTVSTHKSDTLTTEVHGKIYSCEQRPPGGAP